MFAMKNVQIISDGQLHLVTGNDSELHRERNDLPWIPRWCCFQFLANILMPTLLEDDS